MAFGGCKQSRVRKEHLKDTLESGNADILEEWQCLWGHWSPSASGQQGRQLSSSGGRLLSRTRGRQRAGGSQGGGPDEP